MKMSLREWHHPGAKPKTGRVGSKEGKVQGEASGFYAQTIGDLVLKNGASNSAAWRRQSGCYAKSHSQLVLKIGSDDTQE